MNQPTHRRTLWTILFIAFLDNLSVGILLPLVPLLLTSQSSGISILPGHLNDAQGYILFGYLQAIYTIGQFFSTPVLGQLSDRYGRKPILVLSLIGTGLAYLLFGYGVLIRSLPLLFIARAFDGVTGGNISVAQAVIADITDPKDRAKTYGLFGGALGIGFAVGPAIGTFFSNPGIVPWFNATTPFWVTGGIAILSALITALALTETAKKLNNQTTKQPVLPLAALINAFKFPNLRQLLSGIFIWRLGFAFWTTFGAVFLIYRFGLNQEQLGIYFLNVGIWLVLSQLFLVRIITRKLQEEKILYLSIFAAALLFLLILIPRDWHILLWFVPFIACANALSLASVPSVVSKAAAEHTQGEFAGMSNSVQSLALSIAPILSGYISASLTPLMVVSISSFLMIASGMMFVIYNRHHTPSTD